MRKLSVFGLFFVSQLIFALPGAHAASVKVDVCHSEGNGSFHLINISDKAVPAHRRHGDALPGEGVPGAPGTEFDEFCDQVLASTCPCDFSASGLAEVNIDGFGDEECTDFGPGAVRIITDTDDAASADASGEECRRVSLGVLIDFFGGLPDDQIDDCLFDLRQADACQTE